MFKTIILSVFIFHKTQLKGIDLDVNRSKFAVRNVKLAQMVALDILQVVLIFGLEGQ